MKTSLNRFAVFGGDMRQVYLAECLAEKGYEVVVYGLCESCKHLKIREASSLEAALEYAEAVDDNQLLNRLYKLSPEQKNTMICMLDAYITYEEKKKGEEA